MERIVLTPKQQRFCDEYLIDMNATQAALRAGYSGSTALSGTIMAVPKVRLYLQERVEIVSKKAQCTHEMIVAELMKIAFANMGNYFRADGMMKAMHELTDDEKAGLLSLRVKESEESSTISIRMSSKLSALDKLAKHTNFYNAEQPQVDKEYVYVDKDTIDEYDTFDDELFAPPEDEDDDDFMDDEDDQYYPWDTECKVAVAKARAACRERHKVRKSGALSSESGVGGKVAVAVAVAGSPESGEDSPESGVLSRESKKVKDKKIKAESLDEAIVEAKGKSAEEKLAERLDPKNCEHLTPEQREKYAGMTAKEIAEMICVPREKIWNPHYNEWV